MKYKKGESMKNLLLIIALILFGIMLGMMVKGKTEQEIVALEYPMEQFHYILPAKEIANTPADQLTFRQLIVLKLIDQTNFKITSKGITITGGEKYKKTCSEVVKCTDRLMMELAKGKVR